MPNYKIINIMLAKDLGGIQQVFIDYAICFTKANYDLLNIIHPRAEILEEVEKHNLNYQFLKNSNKYDPFARLKLFKILKNYKPDFVILHGNRPMHLANMMQKLLPNIKFIAVCHNNWLKHTPDYKNYIMVSKYIESDLPKNANIFHIPNAISLLEKPVVKTTDSANITIGALGRIVDYKGFHILIQAFAKAKATIPNIKLIIAGDGEMMNELKAMTQTLHLTDDVSFLGWIKDKSAFFSKINIFCMPSLIEPFGIVALEGAKYATPLIVTDAEGPKSIFTHNHDCLMTQKGNIEDLAKQLTLLIQDQHLQKTLQKNATKLLNTKYSLDNMQENLTKMLEKLGNK